MSKAFIDTTVYTDALLQAGDNKKNALIALKKFDITEFPVYGIKEFKAGPLNNFVWLHNKFATLKSYTNVLNALHRMSRTPRRYITSTAIEALAVAAGSIGNQTPAGLSEKYGKNASQDRILCDESRLALKTLIMKAWKRRRRITTNIVNPLTCYIEKPPYEKRGLIELDPKGCDSEECSLSNILKSRIDDLSKMKDAIKDLEKTENQNRYKTLREICRKPKTVIQEKHCKYLGDAIFVLLAPDDSIILTTNIKDFKPLADALGKTVKTPQDYNI